MENKWFFLINDYNLPLISSILLFFAMIFYWISLSNPKKNFLENYGKIFVIISNILLTLTLTIRWIKEGYFPLSNLYESLIFLTWSISTINLILESKTKSTLISSIVTPILFFITSFSSFILPIEMQKSLALVPSLQSNWLMLHVSMMMTSYATLMVGSLLSIIYVIFDKEQILDKFNINKNKNYNINNISINNNLLDNNIILSYKKKEKAKDSLLEIIDLWSYRIIGIGFPFLTIGIISGAVWANEAWGEFWSWDPKETWALITWLIFAIYLHSRLIKGWQGQKTALVASFGFFIIWICYLGVNFLGKGLHSYGWVL